MPLAPPSPGTGYNPGDFAGLDQILSGIFGGGNSDPMRSQPQNSAENMQHQISSLYTGQPTEPGLSALSQSYLQLAITEALSAAGINVANLSTSQWDQIGSMIQATPALWNFFTNTPGVQGGIAKAGTGAIDTSTNVNQFTAFVKQLSAAFEGSEDPSAGGAITTWAQQLGNQQGLNNTQVAGQVGGTSVGPALNNSYAVGNCTYYVASVYQLPSNLGNAGDWLTNAKNDGLATSATPAVGSIVVYGSGGGYSQYGHVAIVTAVNSNGTFQVTEMNATGGLGQVDSRTSTMTDVEGFINQPGPVHGSVNLTETQQQSQQENTNDQISAEFPGLDGIFEKYFGRVPTTTEQLQAVGATGITTTGGANGFVAGTPSQYQAMIQAASQKFGVGTLLLSAQLKQESGFNPNAVSSAGAMGIAQFMPGTAAGLGVNPLDPTSAINGMAQLDAQNYKQFGSWTNALIAYNGGPGAVGSSGGQPAAYVSDIEAMIGNIEQAGTPGASTVQVTGGTTDAATQEANIRAMPSHLEGMNAGQYSDLKAATDSYSNTLLGHTSTDGIVQMLFNSGQTTPAAIKLWYDTQSGAQLASDAATAPIYNAIAQATSPLLQAIYGENGNDPGVQAGIYQGSPESDASQSGAPTAPQAPATPTPSAYGGYVPSNITKLARRGG